MIVSHCNNTLIQELPKLPFICTKYHLDTIYRSKEDMIILVAVRQYNALYHGAASGIGEAEPGRRTHRNTRRTYCCAVRWVVTDKGDIILIANFGGSIAENRIPQLGTS